MQRELGIKKIIPHGVGNPPSSLNSLLRVFELFFPFQVCMMILGIPGQVLALLDALSARELLDYPCPE